MSIWMAQRPWRLRALIKPTYFRNEPFVIVGEEVNGKDFNDGLFFQSDAVPLVFGHSLTSLLMPCKHPKGQL